MNFGPHIDPPEVLVQCIADASKSICHVVLSEVNRQWQLLQEEFRLTKLTFHWDFGRRAASRRVLPHTSSVIAVFR